MGRPMSFAPCIGFVDESGQLQPLKGELACLGGFFIEPKWLPTINEFVGDLRSSFALDFGESKEAKGKWIDGWAQRDVWMERLKVLLADVNSLIHFVPCFSDRDWEAQLRRENQLLRRVMRRALKDYVKSSNSNPSIKHALANRISKALHHYTKRAPLYTRLTWYLCRQVSEHFRDNGVMALPEIVADQRNDYDAVEFYSTLARFAFMTEYSRGSRNWPRIHEYFEPDHRLVNVSKSSENKDAGLVIADILVFARSKIGRGDDPEGFWESKFGNWTKHTLRSLKPKD